MSDARQVKSNECVRHKARRRKKEGVFQVWLIMKTEQNQRKSDQPNALGDVYFAFAFHCICVLFAIQRSKRI